MLVSRLEFFYIVFCLFTPTKTMNIVLNNCGDSGISQKGVEWFIMCLGMVFLAENTIQQSYPS